MPTRFTITFTGRVQGVGFRYTTERTARGFAVTGFVRNEPDGSVLCVAEGERDEIERFIAAVQGEMSGYIRQASMSELRATGEFPSFTIRT